MVRPSTNESQVRSITCRLHRAMNWNECSRARTSAVGSKQRHKGDEAQSHEQRQDQPVGIVDHRRPSSKDDPGLDEAADLRMLVEITAKCETGHGVEGMDIRAFR